MHQSHYSIVSVIPQPFSNSFLSSWSLLFFCLLSTLSSSTWFLRISKFKSNRSPGLGGSTLVLKQLDNMLLKRRLYLLCSCCLFLRHLFHLRRLFLWRKWISRRWDRGSLKRVKSLSSTKDCILNGIVLTLIHINLRWDQGLAVVILRSRQCLIEVTRMRFVLLFLY